MREIGLRTSGGERIGSSGKQRAVMFVSASIYPKEIADKVGGRIVITVQKGHSRSARLALAIFPRITTES